MLLQALLPSFRDELEKIAKSGSVESRVVQHHQSEKKDWKAFEKNMKSPRFVAELKKHPESDSKLKAYAEANNQYARSKSVVVQIPSSTGKMYSIKKLPDGRLGCGCKDWQYKHSWEKTDCKHIRAVKATGLDKSAAPSLSILGRGAGLANMYEKSKKRVGTNR